MKLEVWNRAGLPVDYQISLAMELRWRALPAGSDNIRLILI